MFVCLTTSNYPDVMLPAYLHNRAAFFFWMIFLTLGLFLFMNMLLAIFYTAYQDKSTQIIEKYDNKRNTYLNKLYTSL